MSYIYATLSRYTVFVSDILIVDGKNSIDVKVQRDNSYANCTLPFISWSDREDFTDSECKFLEEFIVSNEDLIYSIVQAGGLYYYIHNEESTVSTFASDEIDADLSDEELNEISMSILNDNSELPEDLDSLDEEGC